MCLISLDRKEIRLFLLCIVCSFTFISPRDITLCLLRRKTTGVGRTQNILSINVHFIVIV